jgi:hypothetical protein
MVKLRNKIRKGDLLIHKPSKKKVKVISTSPSLDQFSIFFEDTSTVKTVSSNTLSRIKDWKKNHGPLAQSKTASVESEEPSLLALRRENSVLTQQLQKRQGNADLLIAKFEQWVEDNPIELEVPKKPKRDASKNKDSEVAVLVISDVQLAKRTPTYNMAIAEQRLMKMIQKTVHITNVRRKAANINKLKVFFVGDLVEGETIFPHQAWETEANLMVQACREFPRMTAQLLLHAAEHFDSVETHWVSGNHGRCHDDVTELLTREGWKTHDQLIEGELVATYNVHSECTEWQPLKKIHRSYFNGDMVSLQNRTQDFLVTPKHDILSFARERDGRLDPTKPKRKSRGKWDEGFVKAQEFVGRHTDSNFITSAPSSIKTEYAIEDDEIRLAAWILTDGSIRKIGSKSRGLRKVRACLPSIKIFQSKEEGKKEIRRIFDSLGIKYSERTRERKPEAIGGVAVKTAKKQSTFNILAESIPDVTKVVDIKHVLPEWVWKLDSRQFNIFLETLIQGDGSVWKKGLSRNLWGTKDFLDQVQALCLMNDVSARVLKNKRGYCLSIRTKNTVFPSKNMKNIPYSGTVWCGETDNQTLITRRNGCPLISGNSGLKHGGQHPDTNWDSVTAHCTKGIVHSYPELRDRITFDIVDDDFYTVVDVEGWGCLLFHGHQINGGLGAGGGPFKKKIQGWAQILDKPFNYSFHGHFHNPMVVTVNDIVCYQNGTTESTNRFAQEVLAAEGVPMQWLMFFNREHGLISENMLWLDERKPARSRKS